jgi:hypothetical protein
MSRGNGQGENPTKFHLMAGVPQSKQIKAPPEKRMKRAYPNKPLQYAAIGWILARHRAKIRAM